MAVVLGSFMNNPISLISYHKKQIDRERLKQTVCKPEPIIKMSREIFSVVDFDCRFAPNFEFCFDFLKMHDWMQQAKLSALNLSLVRQVNKNRTTEANSQILKFNRNVLVTHSYIWL